MSMRESLLLLIRLPLCILPSASSISPYFVQKNFQASYVIRSMRQRCQRGGIASPSCKQQELPNHGEVTEPTHCVTTRSGKRSTRNGLQRTKNKRRGACSKKAKKRSSNQRPPYGVSGISQPFANGAYRGTPMSAGPNPQRQAVLTTVWAL